ncbi:MAG: hypothetical protein IPG66_06855 [Hydrogenophilales bacterium]|nr:hypothetical protein [Hydrogenophilales bacterium]
MKKHINTWVALLLVLGLCAAGIALYAGSVAPSLFGPRLIAQDSQGRVWLVVNHSLFITDAVGNIRKQRDLSGIDGGMPVNGLARLPDKDGNARMLVAVIGQPAWWVMQDGEIAERFVPQDVGGALDEAFHVMTRPDGAIALATGGDHRVLRHDPQGKRLAASKHGLFRFANGGEYIAGDDGKGLWLVPDTNHHALRFLDQDTLTEVRAIPLSGGWVSMARAGRTPGQYTVALMGNAMDTGRVVDVDANGATQLTYPLRKGAKPRGLAWLGDTLLVADADSFTFQAFGRDGKPLGDWGGKDLKAFLDKAGDEAHGWRIATLIGQIVGGVLVFTALTLYFAGKHWLTLGMDPGEPLNLSQLATPRPDARTRLKLTLGLLWPSMLLLPVVLIMQFAADIANWMTTIAPPAYIAQLSVQVGLPASVIASMIVLLLALGMVLLLVLLQFRVNVKALRDPRYEGLVALRAVRWLERSRDVGNALQPGESVREVLFAGRTLVWVLTNRRLLEFDRSLSENTLARALPRSLTRATLTRTRWMPGRTTLRVEGPGYDHSEVVRSPVTAARIAALLGQGVGSDAWAPLPEWSSPSLATGPAPATCMLLSALWPGLAQWAQNRFKQALGLMTAALGTYLFTIGPILLGVYGHHYDVHTSTILTGAAAMAVIIGIATWDALAYARRYRPVTVRP